MIIRDFRASRHLSSRLELGVDDKTCQSHVGKHVRDILTAMQPVLKPLLPEPELSPWSDMAEFYGAEIDLQREIRNQAMMDGRKLQAWWLKQLHETEYPLLERMTLFWHNHFTSDIDKVTWPQYMYWQNKLLRSHALGNFADMLREIMYDPAMLVFLDSVQNRKNSPNENLARELLELFTLGEGHYSESDIVNAARALTGWSVNLRAGKFKFRANQHDEGVKDFLGRRGNFGTDDIIDILLEQERTAEHIAEKFWTEFINDKQPDPMVIRSWAKKFRDSGYEITELLSAVVHSQAFWDERNRGVLIKSPIEFSIGLLRELKLNVGEYEFLRRANQQLGQDLFRPPDVKGWRGGKSWITNTRLIRRYDLIPKFLAEHTGDQRSMLEENILKPRMQLKTDAVPVTGMFRKLLDRLSCNINDDHLTQWLLPIEPVAFPDCDQNLDDMLLTLLKDPTYQLR